MSTVSLNQDIYQIFFVVQTFVFETSRIISFLYYSVFVSDTDKSGRKERAVGTTEFSLVSVRNDGTTI